MTIILSNLMFDKNKLNLNIGNLCYFNITTKVKGNLMASKQINSISCIGESLFQLIPANILE